MLKKIFSLSKFETNIALDNKFVIIYTLLFPTIYFIYQFFTTNHLEIIKGGIVNYLIGYWAYIIITGILNGVISGMLSMRESNFLKMFSYIAGGKKIIFWSNLIPQVFIIQIEIIIFNLIAVALYKSTYHSLKFIVLTLLINFILIPIISFFPTFFLIIPMKNASYSILMTGYLFFSFILLAVKTNSILFKNILSIINPCQYIINVYELIFNFQWSSLIYLGTIALIYIIIGIFLLSKMRISSSTTR